MIKSLFHNGSLILIGGAGMLIFIFTLFSIFMQRNIQVVAKDYYQEEQVYNDLQKARQQGDQLGDKFCFVKNDTAIELKLPKDISEHLTEGSIYLYNVANDRGDEKIKFNSEQSGSYHFSLPKMKGNYSLKCFFKSNSISYFKEIKL